MLLVFSKFIYIKGPMKIKIFYAFSFSVFNINSAQNKGKLKSNKFSEKNLFLVFLISLIIMIKILSI